MNMKSISKYAVGIILVIIGIFIAKMVFSKIQIPVVSDIVSKV